MIFLGGEKEEADLSRINLSSVLKDEQKIIIPYIVLEEEQTKSTNSQTNKTSYNLSSKININYANQNGYTFKTLDETSYGAHHGVNN